ncbi:MAG TPA: PHP domain-containing protein [Thermoleophilia bacterium]|nr:PHP domain-containing protein [Thermoleophilia bacterium]
MPAMTWYGRPPMIDLHAHTTRSDGTLSPAELVELARDLGLTAVAVTDHDTVDGLEEALAAGERLGVEVVPGVELSLEWGERALHVLGYFLNELPTQELHDILVELRGYRDARNEIILERLAKLGYPLDPEEVARVANGGAVGRPHIATVMREHAYVMSLEEAFDRFLKKGAPAYVDRRRLSLSEGMRLLQRSAGIASLAHPGIIPVDAIELEHIVRSVAAEGVAGIECYYGAYDRSTERLCLDIAARTGLVATGGSDFHGAVKPNIVLGIGAEGRPIPDRVLGDLRERYRATVSREE